MPGKRPISFADQEELPTPSSSLHQAAIPNPYQQQNASEYDLELAGTETSQVERQRLLPSVLNAQGAIAYRDGAEPEDLYLAEQANLSLPRSSRKALGSERRRRRRLAILAAILAAILLGGYFGSSFFSVKPRDSGMEYLDDPHILISNGTHDYRKTVLIVSIDGLRSVKFSCSVHLTDLSGIEPITWIGDLLPTS
jgi:hypothetical protein